MRVAKLVKKILEAYSEEHGDNDANEEELDLGSILK